MHGLWESIRVRGASNVIVHLLEFRVVPGHEAELAGYLRHVALVTPPPEGLTARFVGGRLIGQGRAHLAVTAWRDASAFAAGTDADGVPAYLAQVSSLLGDKASGQYRVVASIGLGHERAAVLRVYRSSIATEAVESWERQVIESVHQLAPTEGLLTVIAGVQLSSGASPRAGEANVAVLTAWTKWDVLLTATGGRLNSAIIDTEFAGLERSASADHFEFIESEPGPG